MTTDCNACQDCPDCHAADIAWVWDEAHARNAEFDRAAAMTTEEVTGRSRAAGVAFGLAGSLLVLMPALMFLPLHVVMQAIGVALILGGIVTVATAIVNRRARRELERDEQTDDADEGVTHP